MNGESQHKANDNIMNDVTQNKFHCCNFERKNLNTVVSLLHK
jgi:hypothetical protein